jgi:Tol biopolymer transport system component
LYVIGIDGHGLRQLTNDFADVGVDGISWQPTGGLIAFDSDVTNVMQVYTIRPDGSHRTRLTNGHAYNDQPDFSPDGRTLAYVHTSFHATGATSGINTIDVATRQITHVTDSATRADESPAWSPDARQIVFTRLAANGSTDLERVRLSTSSVTAITDAPWYEYDPSWAPG